jgi:soluble lytic murein transglycosylase
MAAKLGGDTEDYDAFHAVRATSRAGDDRVAIKRYKEFAKRYKKSRLAPDALYLAAWLSAREKLPNASQELEQFVASKHAAQSPGLRRDALWHLAFHAFEKRATRQAKKWLEAYDASVTTPLDRARAAYWRGRVALLSRDKSEARAQFTRAIREERLGYYAQLAARRLMALGDQPPSPFEPAPPPLARPKLPELPAELRFYRQLGLYADAADVATRLLGNEQDRARRVSVFLEAGEPYRASAAAESLLETALAGPPDPARAWIWHAILPRPYARLVLEQTAKYDLSPFLFYGHMQVESRYRPRVVSGADAIGLMQMLPQTATNVGEGLGLKVKRGDLLRPALNVTLGAAYLADLIAHYRGQYPVAIAAYNAGTQKVEEWLGRSKEFELDRWVELIPVEQTRNYVRRVIAGWSRYHALEAPNDPWSLPLPEKVSLPTR